MSKVTDTIKEVAKAENINIDFSNPDTNLKDLKVDSLAAMNLIMKIEDKLGVTLEDEKLLNIKTLNDLIKAFQEKL